MARVGLGTFQAAAIEGLAGLAPDDKVQKDQLKAQKEGVVELKKISEVIGDFVRQPGLA